MPPKGLPFYLPVWFLEAFHRRGRTTRFSSSLPWLTGSQTFQISRLWSQPNRYDDYTWQTCMCLCGPIVLIWWVPHQNRVREDELLKKKRYDDSRLKHCDWLTAVIRSGVVTSRVGGDYTYVRHTKDGTSYGHSKVKFCVLL